MGFCYIACANIQVIIAYAIQFCIVSLRFRGWRKRVDGDSSMWREKNNFKKSWKLIFNEIAVYNK